MTTTTAIALIIWLAPTVALALTIAGCIAYVFVADFVSDALEMRIQTLARKAERKAVNEFWAIQNEAAWIARKAVR